MRNRPIPTCHSAPSPTTNAEFTGASRVAPSAMRHIHILSTRYSCFVSPITPAEHPELTLGERPLDRPSSGNNRSGDDSGRSGDDSGRSSDDGSHSRRNWGSTALVDILQWPGHFEPWPSWFHPSTTLPLERSVLILSSIFSAPNSLNQKNIQQERLFPE